MACNLLSFQSLQAERRDSIPLRSTMMTYPDDCRAYKAKAESMEGHIRSTPAIGKPKGADRAGAYEPFKGLSHNEPLPVKRTVKNQKILATSNRNVAGCFFNADTALQSL